MFYQDYFNNQIGSGNVFSSGINRVYVGSPYQRGHGIGGFLGGLFRKAIPLLSRGLKAMGREALRTGLNVLGDVAQAVPLNESLHRRVKESGGNLKRKAEEKFDALMRGDGYNARRGRTLSSFVLNSLGTARAAYVAKKKKKKTQPSGRKKKRNGKNKIVNKKRPSKKKSSAKKKRPVKKKIVKDIFS